jgi:hypothetical protein
MFVRAKLVPRRVRTEARFRAEDPWNGGAPAEFSIEAYYYAPEHVREASALCRLGGTPMYSLRSAAGGAERFLPDALSHLWKVGKVSAEALPGLLREIEPDLAQDDFRPMLGAPTEQRALVVLTLLLLATVGLLLSWPRGGGGGVPWLALLCGATVAGGLLGGLFTVPPYFARRGRRRRQMDWALGRLGVPAGVRV